jgi:hypothetical protein
LARYPNAGGFAEVRKLNVTPQPEGVDLVFERMTWMEQRATFECLVTSAEDGRPITSARVLVSGAWQTEARQCLPGIYRTVGPTEGNWEVLVSAPGFRNARSTAYFDRWVESMGIVPLGRGVRVQGRIVAPEWTPDLNGAQLSEYAAAGTEFTTLDADGRFTIDAAIPGSPLVVMVKADGPRGREYSFSSVDDAPIVPEKGFRTPVELRVDAGGSLKVRVVELSSDRARPRLMLCREDGIRLQSFDLLTSALPRVPLPAGIYILRLVWREDQQEERRFAIRPGSHLEVKVPFR